MTSKEISVLDRYIRMNVDNFLNNTERIAIFFTKILCLKRILVVNSFRVVHRRFTGSVLENFSEKLTTYVLNVKLYRQKKNCLNLRINHILKILVKHERC